MSMIIDGTNGLTFNNATTQASAGVVLQAVQATTLSSTSTTSSSFVTTSFSASITPKFSTSKILVLVTGQNYQTTAGKQMFTTIYRGGSNLGDATQGFAPNSYSSTGDITTGSNISYVDSPATTSSTTYTIYIRTNGGTCYFNGANGLATLILMEIAG